MVRTALAAALLAGTSAVAQADSASAPLIVTATVVSTCKVEVDVDVPRWASASTFATWPVTVTCARRGTTPRVQRPIAPRRNEARDAVLIINF